jgi:hypothetical protein
VPVRARVHVLALATLTQVLGCGTVEEESLIEDAVRLEAAARAAVHAEGCSDVSDCRSAPLGVKACGGPRDYVVYCSRTTDEALLLERLRAHAQAEARYNRTVGAVSTCDLVMPPRIELSGGVCQATGGPLMGRPVSAPARAD